MKPEKVPVGSPIVVWLLCIAAVPNASALVAEDSPLGRLKDSGVPELIAVIVSVAALAISVLTHLREHRRYRDEIEERQLARIRAQLVHPGPWDGGNQIEYGLVVENRGSASAEHLRIYLDGVPAKDHDCVNFSSQPLPTSLSAGDSFELVLYFRAEAEKGVLGAAPLKEPSQLTVRWSDAAGSDREYHKALFFKHLPTQKLDLDAILAKGESLAKG